MLRFERPLRRPVLWTEVLSLAGEHWTDIPSAWIQRCRLLWQVEEPSSAYVNPKSLPPRPVATTLQWLQRPRCADREHWFSRLDDRALVEAFVTGLARVGLA